MMKVSIIMPCYNGEKYIVDSIKSVISQTYQTWELIIVDDCSTDNTLAVIQPFLSDERVVLLKQLENCGPVKARNKAIDYASGNIISFLDSDDLWLSEKLEHQVSYFQANRSQAIVFTDYIIIDSEGNKKQIVTAPKIVCYDKLLRSNYIGCLTCSYSADLLGKRYFSEVGHEDYVLWLSILKEGYSAINIGLPLALYRRHEGSLSSNKFIAASWQWKIYRDILQLGYSRSMFYFLNYLYRALKKHLFNL